MNINLREVGVSRHADIGEGFYTQTEPLVQRHSGWGMTLSSRNCKEVCRGREGEGKNCRRWGQRNAGAASRRAFQKGL